MEDLLRCQHVSTLTEWLGEKNLPRFGDLVQRIIDYYSYLDVLCVPSLDSNSEEVFSNKEIVHNIILHCPIYVRNSFSCVNSTTNTVARERKVSLNSLSSCISLSPNKRFWTVRSSFNNSYAVDAISTMDWWHIIKCRLPVISPHIILAARRGYELILPVSDVCDTATMLEYVAKGSDCSHRYYNLFVRLWARLENELESASDEEDDMYYKSDRDSNHRDVLDACVMSSDILLLEYVWKNAKCESGGCGLDNLTSYWSFIQDLAYYGKIDFLKEILDKDWFGVIDYLVAEAYCGGYYTEMLDYAKTIPGFVPLTADEILDKLFYSPVPNETCKIRVDKLSRLTYLVSQLKGEVNAEVIMKFITYLKCQFAMDEFKDLWLVLEDKLVDHFPKDTIIKCIRLGRHDVAHFLQSQVQYSGTLASITDIVSVSDRG